jgi:C4-dicarboxylate-specific signal transduction histidine kinase
METVLVTLTDVTERNRIQEELNRARGELAHASRVTTLGELTGSIAHEVNQPLAAIVTNGYAALSWLRQGTPDLEEIRTTVDRMISDANRAGDVIARLRDMARNTSPVHQPVHLNDIVSEAAALVHGELNGQQVELDLDLTAPSPAVMGDRVQLQQVVINLLLNAGQAMSSITDRPRSITARSWLSPSGEAVVDVEDAGVGIAPDAAQRLFEPFFTTKQQGMGMGLSICRSIIEAHEGVLAVVPKEGPGAMFRFKLPSIDYL